MPTKSPWVRTTPRRLTSAVPSPDKPATRFVCDESTPRRSKLTNGSRRPSGLYVNPCASTASAFASAAIALATGWAAGAPAGACGVDAGAVAGAVGAAACGAWARAVPAASRTVNGMNTRARVTALLRHRRAGRRRCCCRLRIKQHERRRGAVRGDRRCAGLHVRRLDMNGAHIDDSGELAHPLQERAEVVIGPFELQTNRPFRVHLPARHRARRESPNRQARLCRHRLNAAQQITHVLFFRKDRTQTIELRF